MCASVAGIVSTSISINSYLTTNQPKDTGFNVSMAFLVISIFIFFGSAFWMYKTYKGGGGGGGEGGVDAEAAAAAEAARVLGGVEVPTTELVASAVPNVQGFQNVPSLRAAEQSFITAVEQTKAGLNALKASVNKRVANKEAVLQQLAELQAAAATKGA